MSITLDDGSGAIVQQPQNQSAYVTPVAATSASNSSPYGFTTAAQANALVTNVNAIQTALVAAGIMKSS